VTNGGGLGAACADAAEEAGLRIDPLPAAAAERLRGRLPGFASVRNPLDLTAAAGDDAFGAALEECLAAPDAAYDAAVVVCLGAAPALTAGVARRIGDAAKRSGRPVVAMHVGGARGRSTGDALEASGIPVFPTPERAIGAVRALVLRGEALARLGRASTGSPPPRPRDGDAKSGPAIEARAFLDARGVRFPAGAEAVSPEDAARAARTLRGPYVLKVLSPDAIHKTEFGGVVTGLATPPDVLAAAREMDARFASRFPEIRRSGFRVEEHAPPALAEVVVGGLRDATFGPAVAFGAGGVLVELLKDTSWRLAPLDDDEAREAIRSIRTFPVLDGFRGRPRADVAALAAVLRAVGDLLASDPRISEIDLNPVLAYEHGAIAVDVRILE
jgi:acetyltransferase